MSFGIVSGLKIGDRIIPCPYKFDYLEVGTTRSGRLRLNSSDEDEGWIMLTHGKPSGDVEILDDDGDTFLFKVPQGKHVIKIKSKPSYYLVVDDMVTFVPEKEYSYWYPR